MTSLRVKQSIDANGGGGGGETNTASNEGGGLEVFKTKNGVNLEFRTITQGTGVTIIQNADTLEISASPGGLTNTDDLNEGSTNLYYTEGRVDANSSVQANTAKVSADGSIATHSDVTLSSLAVGHILEWNGSQFVNVANSGGSGEANIATNVGGGFGLAKAKSGVELPFKTFLAGTNISLVDDGNTITVNSLAGGGSDTTVVVKLGAGATIADKVSNAPIGGIPAGYTVVDGTNGSVDGQLSGDANDLIIIHNEGKIAVNLGIVSTDTLFGGHLNRPFAAGDLKTESNSDNQTRIKGYTTLTGTGASVLTFDLV